MILQIIQENPKHFWTIRCYKSQDLGNYVFESSGKDGHRAIIKIRLGVSWKSWAPDQYLPEHTTWNFGHMGTISSNKTSNSPGLCPGRGRSSTMCSNEFSRISPTQTAFSNTKDDLELPFLECVLEMLFLVWPLWEPLDMSIECSFHVWGSLFVEAISRTVFFWNIKPNGKQCAAKTDSWISSKSMKIGPWSSTRNDGWKHV